MVRRRERPVVAAPEPETESPASRGSCSGHGVTLLSEPEPRGEQRPGGKKTRRKISSDDVDCDKLGMEKSERCCEETIIMNRI